MVSADRARSRTFVVTGAASGIGLATVSRLLGEGGTVVGGDLAAPPDLGPRFRPIDTGADADSEEPCAPTGSDSPLPEEQEPEVEVGPEPKVDAGAEDDCPATASAVTAARQLAALQTSLPAPAKRSPLVVPARVLHEDEQLAVRVGPIRGGHGTATVDAPG